MCGMPCLFSSILKSCTSPLLLLRSGPASDGDPSMPVTSPNTRPQAVAITMSPKHKDPLLRFYDMSPQYAQHEEWLEKWLVRVLLQGDGLVC